MIFRQIINLILGLLVLFLILHTLIRIIRHFYKFPIPDFLVNLIDNPLRRRIQPPDGMPQRHGILPGMKVLEIGPGNGRYTLASARRVGPEGWLTTLDIEPKVIERIAREIEAKGITNLEARVGDVFALPFQDSTFDVVYMIAVIGEIPTPWRAMEEFRRVLKPGGTMAFSEILMDPDYMRVGKLEQLAGAAGFQLIKKTGSFFSYTAVFKKEGALDE